MFGKLSFSDIGRHPSNAVIRVSLTLRYNHQNQLDERSLSSPIRLVRTIALFLQEITYYAPTSEQERSVLARCASRLHDRQAFPNRTIVDATARTAVVEKLFLHRNPHGTSGQVRRALHERDAGDVAQTSRRSCATFPSIISSSSERSSNKAAAVAAHFAAVPGGRRRDAPSYRSPVSAPTILRGNLVNGGFENGSVKPGGSTKARGRAIRSSDDRASASRLVFRIHGLAVAARSQRLGVDRANSESSVERRR